MTSAFRSERNAVLLIAEIGGNHEGDFDYARRLAALGVESGADAVKFQLYTGDTLVSRRESPDRNAHFKKFELTRDQHLDLARAVTGAGRLYMASVWDAAMLEWIDPFIRIHKVGSGDLTCWPLLRRLMAGGKPMILSTGLASLAEIEATLAFIGRTDPAYIAERKVALLQCTTLYPCPDDEINLRAMETLGREFGMPVGFSDHSVGTLAVEAAVALGAEIIEKHFTDQREGKTFRDHKVSATRDELRELLPRLARIAAMRGPGGKALRPAEAEAGHDRSFRRSVYAARDIAAGEVLGDHNLTLLRPFHGLCASRYDEVVGKRIRRPLGQHEPLLAEDVGLPP